MIKKGKILNCAICGKEVYARPSVLGKKKYCSYSCLYKSGVFTKPKTGKWGNCTCGKKIWIKLSEFNSTRYCSQECSSKANIIENSKVELRCKHCGKGYFLYRKYLKMRKSSFCSVKCSGLARRLKKHPRWKSGKTLKKNLWTFFSQYIRQRDKGICISCGRQEYWRKMDAGHYIPKTAGLSLYFDEQNVHCQCTYCNRWMHGNLAKYAIALRQKYGENILEDLDKKRKIIRKISIIEYSKLTDFYKEKLKQYDQS